MTYQELSAQQAIEGVRAGRFVMPAIQREFVWDHEQIAALFDSIMRGYPIGAFLFWHVAKEQFGQFVFYQFLREFHARDSYHNPTASPSGLGELTVVLDGQQRLTALNIGLLGSYAYKSKNKRWDNDLAFPKRRLFLNLLGEADTEELSREFDLKYDFRFLTGDETVLPARDKHWFKVGKILEMSPQEVDEYLSQNDLMESAFAKETLHLLHESLRTKKVIHYYLEQDQDLEKVLNIFIRANNGGTELSYSDMLLSIATANWKNQNAREEINQLVDDLNATGGGFDLNKDFILKTSLVLSNIDVGFKVKNFNRANVSVIEKNWPKISDALRLTVRLAAHFGFQRENLPTNNVLIPIAHYIMKSNINAQILDGQKYAADRVLIRKYLTICILKKTFSASSDNVLRWMRDVINEGHAHFPLADINDKLQGFGRSLKFAREELENILDYEYGEPWTFSALSVLYPSLDFSKHLHVDHLHPRSAFSKRNLDKVDISKQYWDAYIGNRDRLVNLQLLNELPNEEKSSSPLGAWIDRTCRTDQAKRDYYEKHYVPQVSLEFTNFIEFVKEREKLLLKALEKSVRID
jgi:uncharacterized protein with ParB-like and HNH nuclease domain